VFAVRRAAFEALEGFPSDLVPVIVVGRLFSLAVKTADAPQRAILRQLLLSAPGAVRRAARRHRIEEITALVGLHDPVFLE